jgi:hypothetical protein
VACAFLVAEPLGLAEDDPAPAEYLDEVLDVVKEQAYYAERVDWVQWRADATIEASTAQDSADSYDFVRRLLFELGDHHSFFVPPSSNGDEPFYVSPFIPPEGSVGADSIGLLKLPGYSTEDPWGADYVAAARVVLAAPACGWIVDLRGNDGGNLYPMLAALAPLLGPGPLVGYRYRDGRTDSYLIEAGGAVVGIAADGSEHRPPTTDSVRFTAGSPIAVVHGPATASSGEGVVMAMRGRPRVRSFGQPTSGVPTGNVAFQLSDGSGLVLTVAVGVDFGGVVHESAIDPDIRVRGADDAAEAARSWLAREPECQTR